jgi:hypothetical protein
MRLPVHLWKKWRERKEEAMADIFEQAEAAAAHGERRSRDADALQFLQALDEGNLEVLAALAEKAEHDPALSPLLDGVLEEYIKEGGNQ